MRRRLDRRLASMPLAAPASGLRVVVLILASTRITRPLEAGLTTVLLGPTAGPGAWTFLGPRLGDIVGVARAPISLASHVGALRGAHSIVRRHTTLTMATLRSALAVATLRSTASLVALGQHEARS